MKDKAGNEIVATEENAADLARKEMDLEKDGKNPELETVEDLTLQPEEPKEEPKGEPKEPVEEPKEEPKTDEDLISAKPEDLNDEEKVKREELIAAEDEETKRLLDAKEEDLEPGDKEKRKVAVLKNETKNKESFETKVSEYAKTKDIEPEEARRTLEGAKTVIEKYEGDSEKIAIAHLGLQQLVSKKDEDIKAAREEASQPRMPQSAMEWEYAIKERGLVTTGGVQENWEKVVENYRAKNPRDTEGLEDDQVLRTVAKEIHLRASSHYKERSLKDKTDANEKREKLITNLPESEKKFSSDLKALLKTIPDRAVLDKNYTLEHSISWARGRYFTPDKLAELEKESEQKGFERGQASKKIISGVIGKSSPASKKTTPILSKAEEIEADDMFPNVDDPKERAKMYIEIRDDRKKNKK